MAKRRTSFTGRERGRGTPPGVRRAERVARILIAAGGVGTIVAVTLILLFLVWVVWPLFRGAEVESEREHRQAGAGRPRRYLAGGMDEYRLLNWTLDAEGTLRVVRLDNGELLKQAPFPSGRPATAFSFPPGNENAFLVGFGDGSVRAGTIRFRSRYWERAAAPPELREIRPGEIRSYREGVASLTREQQVRLVRLQVEIEEPFPATGSAIRLLDYSIAPQGRIFAALTVDGRLGVHTETTVLDMGTGEERRTVETLPIAYAPPAGRGPPDYLKLGGIGNLLFLVWKDGHTIRFDARDRSHARAAETFEATDGGAAVTAVRFLVGKTTLMIGDSAGLLRAWFPTRPEGAETVDGIVTRNGHLLRGPGGAVTSLAPSPVSRLLAAGYAEGGVLVWQVTNATRVLEGRAPFVDAVLLAPREDAVAAYGGGALRVWNFFAGYPEASVGSLLGRVWYEGEAESSFVWQSTGGSDAFEPKLSLVPLLFGTLKATLYAMLIAAPIALLAAIFTSEFLSPRLRTPIKSMIEMLASLPSVVLGFLAALVIAPFVQDLLPAVLAALLAVPVMLLLGSRLWQFLPQRLSAKWSGTPRLAALLLAFPLGIGAAAWFGRAVVEGLFFEGDIKGWLDGRVGAVGSGWTFLLLPLCCVLASLAVSLRAGPWIRSISTGWSRRRCALFDLVRMAAVALVGFAAAAGIAALLGRLGLDPRGEVLGVDPGRYSAAGIVGTYSQRNAMIVGFVMGFAIVPIIYTLAEDALSSVPRELREGSLAAGATRWQTAMRIVLPTAMSGLFGASMVGLGRAVGETMILLMAAGNTPLMEWNPFSGFRTLSANIAVELPEAVRGSTHYRTLFLAALLLFGITFCINSLAELVRRRFRARYAEQL